MITAAASARVFMCHLRHLTGWRSWTLRRQTHPLVGSTANLPHQLDGWLQPGAGADPPERDEDNHDS
jgi:hypothetical protein